MPFDSQTSSLTFTLDDADIFQIDLLELNCFRHQTFLLLFTKTYFKSHLFLKVV